MNSKELRQDRETLTKARAVLIRHLDTMGGFPVVARATMQIIGQLDEYTAVLTRRLDALAEAKRP